MLEPTLTVAEILKALAEYYERGDFNAIETINTVSFGMKGNLRKKHHVETTDSH